MSEPVNDPSSNTQAFQAWVNQNPEQLREPAAKSKTPAIIITVVVVLVVLAGLGWLAFG